MRGFLPPHIAEVMARRENWLRSLNKEAYTIEEAVELIGERRQKTLDKLNRMIDAGELDIIGDKASKNRRMPKTELVRLLEPLPELDNFLRKVVREQQ